MAKILVIEDEEAVRQLVQRMLHEAGHKVLLASGSVNGLRLWQSYKIGLVVADLGLPDGTGLESIIEMRTLEPNLPLIRFLREIRRSGIISSPPATNSPMLSAI